MPPPITLTRFVVLLAAISTVLSGRGYAEESALATETTLAASNLENFDAAWTIVRDTHFDPEMGGIDWQAVREELRPKAEAAADIGELRSVLQDMLSRLQLSHFAILPRESVDALIPDRSEQADDDDADDDDAEDDGDAGDSADDESEAGATEDGATEDASGDSEDEHDNTGGVGLTTRLIGDEMLVTGVTEKGPAARSGVKCGWGILAIGGRPVSELLALIPADLAPNLRAFYAMQMILNRLEGAPGSRVTVSFQPAEGEPVEFKLKRRLKPGELVQFGGLPPLNSHAESRRISDAASGTEVGLIAFNIWMTPLSAAIDEAVDDLRGTDGIILDLRGNPGGVGFMATGIAGHFLNKKILLGTMKTRSNDLKFIANPRRVLGAKRVVPYAGPLAILVDVATGSTSEIFAAGMQSVGRARVFGQTSMGAALPAASERLPNQDVLLHAVGDYVLPDGSRVEGKGVVPDEPIALDRQMLLAEGDPVLAAAVRWIVAQKTNESK